MTFDNEKIKKYKEKKEAFKKENINNHVIKKYGYIHYSRKKEMKELDVVYDEGIWGTLLLLRRSTQGKLALPLNYSIGALKQLKYDSRRTNKEIYNAQGIKEFDDFIFKNECNELEKELTLYNKITIWSKYNDTNNALLPLYFVNRFYDVIKEKEISIIYIDEKDNPNIDLDSYSIEEFENKVANRKIITRENLKYSKNEWDNLIQKDSDIRKLNFPEISHHYLEEYKEKIISLYSNGMKFNQLILAVMDSLKLTYSESMYLIYEMSQKGIFLFKNDGKGFLKVDRTVLLRKPVEEELNKKYKAVKFLKDDIYMVSSISTNIFPYYHDEHADVTELGLWGIVNSDKEILIDTKYLYSFYEVGENKFIVCKGDTWKKINSTTRGNAVVSDNKKFGLIDIEDNVIIDNLCQIAHNVHIGYGTAVAGGTTFAGSVTIGKYCIIGGTSVFNGHISICDGVTISGMCMVMRSIDKPGIYSSGIPAQTNKEWRITAARTLHIIEMYHRLSSLEEQVESLTKQLKQ